MYRKDNSLFLVIYCQLISFFHLLVYTYLPAFGCFTIAGNKFISTLLQYYHFTVFSLSTCSLLYIIKPIHAIVLDINHIVLF